jgi:hypothetical protein
MTDTAVVISDPYRVPIMAERRRDGSGGVLLRRAPSTVLALGQDEFDRLVAFVRNEPTIQRYPVTK